MNQSESFSYDVLKLDAEQEVAKICTRLRNLLSRKLKRRGLVVGLSGGIDSSVTAALAAAALGPDRVIALLMPERHSDKQTLTLSKIVADYLGIDTIHENISNILEAVGFYSRYLKAVQIVVPEYREGWKSKIVIPNILEKKGFSLFSIVARTPSGSATITKRLPLKAYLEIVAATNFKQRIRKMLEYYHADRNNFAVAGTPNRLEYDQGFFVKLGDGASDVKLIAHLYKTQVYQLAEHLGIPEEIRKRPPTTDTYSLPQSQDEFYFSLPYDKMDLCLYGHNHNILPSLVASTLELTSEQVSLVYQDIDTKRATTQYLHLPPLLMEEVEEIVI